MSSLVARIDITTILTQKVFSSEFQAPCVKTALVGICVARDHNNMIPDSQRETCKIRDSVSPCVRLNLQLPIFFYFIRTGTCVKRLSYALSSKAYSIWP